MSYLCNHKPGGCDQTPGPERVKDRDVPLHSHSGEQQDGRRVGQTLHEVVDLAHRLEIEPGIDGSFLAYSLTFEPVTPQGTPGQDELKP